MKRPRIQQEWHLDAFTLGWKLFLRGEQQDMQAAAACRQAAIRSWFLLRLSFTSIG